MKSLSLPITVFCFIITTLTLLLTFQIESVHSEKILVLAMISTRSHKITYLRLVEELAARGHSITIVSPVKASKEIKNIKEIFTIDMDKMMEEMNIFEMKEQGIKLNPFMMLDDFGSVCRQTYDLPEVKELLKEKFDLIFLQPLFNDCALGLVHKLNTSLVLFNPTSVPGFMVNNIGGHFPTSFVSNIFLGYPSEMNFFQRFTNFGMTLVQEAILRFYYEPYMTALYREKLGQDIPTSREILANASLILSNGHFILSSPKPYLPDTIDVGGIHSRPAKPLPKDLEDFVSKSGSENGFILFSMGSAIKGDQMPEAKRKMFLRVFSKLKQQIVWKWESETMPDLPKNVQLSKWLPQQDLLGHKNIRMFITHCGGGGTEEAIYHAVPLLGLPFLGDQPLNARQAKNLGFLVQLEWNDLTEEELMSGIQEILNNSTYRENVQRLSSIFRDQPDDPLARGVYWVEYVMRHKGAPHLRSASRKLNVIQYHSIDVIFCYLAIIATILGLIFGILRCTLRYACSKFCKSSTTKMPNKKQQLSKKKQ